MFDYSLYSDEELMEEIKANNMFAFDALYRRYSRQICIFAYSILKSTEEAENILQDVFLNLWENRINIKKNSSVKSYLFTITHNSAISIIREEARKSKFIEHIKALNQSDQDPVNKELELLELWTRLNEVVNSLPTRQKEIYLLHVVACLKYQEISEMLNISMNTIENHMSRAIKTIRKKIKPYI